MITLNTMLAILLIMLHFNVYAAWNINTSGQKGIYVVNGDKHQLSIVENSNGVDFFLSLHINNPLHKPEYALIQVGEIAEKTTHIKLVDNRSGQKRYLLQLSRKQKTVLMNKMISGLLISVKIFNKHQRIHHAIFSLTRFTARLNDFLIAKEIGKLDYEWLMENHRDRELLCYYAANVYVQAIQHRLNKGNYMKTLKSIPTTGIEKLDSITGEMVENVYSIPARKLPRDPRGDKYGIFKACMSRAN